MLSKTYKWTVWYLFYNGDNYIYPAHGGPCDLLGSTNHLLPSASLGPQGYETGRTYFCRNSQQCKTQLLQMYFKAQIAAYKGKKVKCVSDPSWWNISGNTDAALQRHFPVLVPLSCFHPCFLVTVGDVMFSSSQSPFRHTATPKFLDSYARMSFLFGTLTPHCWPQHLETLLPIM